MTIFLTLPAYNEEASLPDLFKALKQELDTSGYEWQIVAVDDGSTDATGHIFQQWSSVLPVHLITHQVNQGLGVTIQDGLRRAAELAQPHDVIVTMDADNTHSPALIPAMAGCIQQGHDLVIASRYCRGSKVLGLSATRRLLTHGARLLYQTILPIPGVRDYTCGFRAYSAAMLQKAFAQYKQTLVTEQSFVCMAEILVKLSRMPLKITEVPMVLRYDLKGGPSKMKVGQTILKSLALILRYRVGRH